MAKGPAACLAHACSAPASKGAWQRGLLCLASPPRLRCTASHRSCGAACRSSPQASCPAPRLEARRPAVSGGGGPASRARFCWPAGMQGWMGQLLLTGVGVSSRAATHTPQQFCLSLAPQLATAVPCPGRRTTAAAVAATAVQRVRAGMSGEALNAAIALPNLACYGRARRAPALASEQPRTTQERGVPHKLSLTHLRLGWRSALKLAGTVRG